MSRKRCSRLELERSSGNWYDSPQHALKRREQSFLTQDHLLPCEETLDATRSSTGQSGADNGSTFSDFAFQRKWRVNRKVNSIKPCPFVIHGIHHSRRSSCFTVHPLSKLICTSVIGLSIKHTRIENAHTHANAQDCLRNSMEERAHSRSCCQGSSLGIQRD